jgi:hypothetical protein
VAKAPPAITPAGSTDPAGARERAAVGAAEKDEEEKDADAAVVVAVAAVAQDGDGSRPSLTPPSPKDGCDASEGNIGSSG